MGMTDRFQQPGPMDEPEDTSDMTAVIIEEVHKERDHQASIWGNDHDDLFSEQDWIALITVRLGLASAFAFDDVKHGYRRKLVQVAALAVAAVEALDREAKRQDDNVDWDNEE